MLKALYDYAVRHDLTPPAGCVKKTVKAYISLSPEGRFLSIIMGGEEPAIAPDIGSLANGKDKSNVLIEKRSVVIPEEPSAKSLFFLNALKDGGETEPMLAICAKALEDETTASEIRSALDQNKVKAADRVSFWVDGRSILESPQTMEWWQDFRQQFRKSDGKGETVCLITGEPTVPMDTTPPIQGLQVVGGHGRGDALICFDKAAFRSYGLKKAENAPVSEEAFTAVKAGLDHLLEDAPILAGMKFVHWYDRKVEPEVDPIVSCIDFGFSLEEDAGKPPEDDENPEQEERSARKRADKLIESVTDKTPAPDLDDVTYYILLLTGVNSRIMIRRYERGNYRELRERLDQWYSDLELTTAAGTALMKPQKLVVRLMRLMSYQKIDSRPFERLSKELSGIAPVILTSILTGSPLPDTVAARALAYIRSMMLSDEDNQERLNWEIGLACQWLKVWLIRGRDKGEVLMREYNPEYHSNAYYSGAMMAIFEAIQQAAMPDVNVTVLQRFYASAVQMPALVLGRLSSMSVHHLEKMENQWLAEHFENYLRETASAMDGRIPATLNLEEQSEFALGYYQMGAKLTKEKLERIAASKERKNKTAENNGQEDD